MRALAVLAVVAYHAFPELFKGGFIGVDVFFVISGFLIGTILFENLEAGTFSFADFYRRRVKRIFPALFVVLMTTLVCGWLFLLPDQFVQLGRYVVSGVFFVSNFTLWKESGYFDGAAELKPLLHLWSLAVEEQFYIFWPLILFFAWKRRSKAFGLIIFVFLFSLFINIRATAIHSSTRFFLPLERFWEILAGSILAYVSLYKKGLFETTFIRRFFAPTQRSVLGMAAIVIAILLLNSTRAFPGWWAILPVAGTALIISAGPNAWLNRTVLSNRPLVNVGLISYSLYLWHWPMLSFAAVIAFGSVPASIRCILVLTAVVVSFATYLGIEKPLRRIHLKYDTFKVTALCSFMLVAAGAGLFIVEQDGFSSRYPPEIREFANIKGVHSSPVRGTV